MDYESAVNAIMETGKTREQAVAFLSIMRSAFARRGWIEGEPDTADKTSANVDLFTDTPTTGGLTR
jgi:hypothetical protein